MSEIILEVQNLKKYYQQGSLFQKKESVKAVDDVSFVLHRKETLAIVGESGCGKSTTVKSIIRLTEPTSGKVILHGEDFTSLKGNALREARKKNMDHFPRSIFFFKSTYDSTRYHCRAN